MLFSEISAENFGSQCRFLQIVLNYIVKFCNKLLYKLIF